MSAKSALKRLGLDYVWWLVTPQNPLKPAPAWRRCAARLCSARSMVAHHPRIIVMDIEQRSARATPSTR